jgi:hypothetical protein
MNEAFWPICRSSSRQSSLALNPEHRQGTRPPIPQALLA